MVERVTKTPVGLEQHCDKPECDASPKNGSAA
jgi:hypothetical protein